MCVIVASLNDLRVLLTKKLVLRENIVFHIVKENLRKKNGIIRYLYRDKNIPVTYYVILLIYYY